MTGLPSRLTSVITATTEVVISMKSKLEFFSSDLSGIAVSRISTMRMKRVRPALTKYYDTRFAAVSPQSRPRSALVASSCEITCAAGGDAGGISMQRWLPRDLWSDARHYQIAALSTLVVYNLGWLDFGARPLNSALAIASSLLTQALCSRYYRLPSIDLRSPLITGLSLSLLLRADEPWLHAVAGVIAIGSKFVFRIDGKHIWNPAGFAIVVLLLVAPDQVWISPGQWGSAIWFAALLCF